MEGIWDSYEDGAIWARAMLERFDVNEVWVALARDFAFVNDREFYKGAEDALEGVEQ